MSHNKPDSKSPRGRKRPELQIVPRTPEIDPRQVKKDRESARGILEKPAEELPWLDLDPTKEEGPELPN